MDFAASHQGRSCVSLRSAVKGALSELSFEDEDKMGGSQSQPPSTPLSQKLRASVDNSNIRNTVIIPVDASKQAESAFLCRLH